MKEVKVASEPAALLKVLGNPTYRFKRPGFQSDPLEAVGGVPRTFSRAAGSLATFTSFTILPVSSTMQMLVSLTDTSNPPKCSMLRFSF